MDEKYDSAWVRFEKSGSVYDYLNFRALHEKHLDFEAGEDFGIDKNIGNSDQGYQVRRER